MAGAIALGSRIDELVSSGCLERRSGGSSRLKSEASPEKPFQMLRGDIWHRWTSLVLRRSSCLSSCPSSPRSATATRLDRPALVLPSTPCLLGEDLPLLQQNHRLRLWDHLVSVLIDVEVGHHKLRRGVRQPFR